MLKHVPPSELMACWPFVEKGLNRILQLCPDTWTARIVKEQVLLGNALLFACEDGFFVSERRVDPHSRGLWLNVWAMYFKPGKGFPRKQELVAQLDALKTELACEFIQFTSPRHKWNAMVIDCFKEHARIWRR